MLKPQVKGKTGEPPQIVGEFYRITVTHVQFVEMDTKDYSHPAPYPLTRGIEEIKSAANEPLYYSEQSEQPAFTKL